MKLKINGNYYADEEGNPIIFSSAIKYESEKKIKLFDENDECITSFLFVNNMSDYTLEDGDWTPAPKTWKELYEEQKVINDEQDELIAELIEQ